MKSPLIRFAFLALVGALVAGCAQPARTSAMVANVTATTVVDEGNPIRQSTTIASVTGGEDTNPAWTSEVGDAEFRQALTLSLKQHTILADGTGPLTLNVRLVDVDQPLIGLSMTVTATAIYTITNDAGETVFEETVKLPYTASFSDAFVGAERLRLANEGAIKANIKRFLELLVARSKAEPGRFGAPATSALKLNLG